MRDDKASFNYEATGYGFTVNVFVPLTQTDVQIGHRMAMSETLLKEYKALSDDEQALIRLHIALDCLRQQLGCTALEAPLVKGFVVEDGIQVGPETTREQFLREVIRVGNSGKLINAIFAEEFALKAAGRLRR